MTTSTVQNLPPPFVRQAVEQYGHMTVTRSTLADRQAKIEAELLQTDDGLRALGDFIRSQGYGVLIEAELSVTAEAPVEASGVEADTSGTGDRQSGAQELETADTTQGSDSVTRTELPEAKFASDRSADRTVTTREAMLRLMSSEHRAYEVAEIVKRVPEFGSNASTVTIRSYINRMSKANQITSAGYGSWVLTREGRDAAAALRNGDEKDAQMSIGSEQ